MKHSFPDVQLPLGANEAPQECKNCGAVRYKHKKGYYFWLTESGSKTPYGPKCGVTGISKPYVQEPRPLPKSLPTIAQPIRMNNHEARLHEALVLINVMYEDMVVNGLRTAGRSMAGRFLYSAGYTEVVKELEKTTL